MGCSRRVSALVRAGMGRDGFGVSAVRAWQMDGATPLYIASETGHVECVRALLSGGAVINQEKVGCTSSIARHCGDCVRRDAWESACVHACMAGRCAGMWDCVGLGRW